MRLIGLPAANASTWSNALYDDATAWLKGWREELTVKEW
jgi:hypothetical protein